MWRYCKCGLPTAEVKPHKAAAGVRVPYAVHNECG